MSEKENSLPDNETLPQRSLLQRIYDCASVIMQKIKHALKGPDPLHPDFRITEEIDEELTWFQNKGWGPVINPPYKVSFYFNDLSVLDNCPWVCKFGKNMNAKFSEFRYFCVAYGKPHLHTTDFGLEEMKKWVLQFDHPSLMTYGGKLMAMMKE